MIGKNIQKGYRKAFKLLPAKKIIKNFPAVYGKNTAKVSARFNRYYQFLKQRPFTCFVLTPWLICALYLIFIKTPVFESSAQIVIEKNDIENALMVNIGFLGKNGGESSNIYLTTDYIASNEMYEQLDKRLHLTEYFQSQSIDWLSRLKADSKIKSKLDFFHKHLTAHYDPMSNKVTLTSYAFDAKYAQKILEETLFYTKLFANKVANNLASVQHEFTAEHLKQAKEKLYLAEKNILSFQNKHGIFDPKETVKAISEVMAKLNADLVSKQTELITYSSFMQPSSSKIIQLKEQINALKEQIKHQTTSLLGQHGATLNTVFADFQWQELKLKFAVAEYEAAQKAYEISSINLAKKQNLLIEIAKPSLPDEYRYPDVTYDLITIFIGLLLAFAILKMVVIIVQEHID